MEDEPEIDWAGSDRIERLVMLSPPNRGSIQALRDAMLGDDVPFMPAFQPAMVTSWISVPQMFPRPEVGWLTDESGRPAEVDIYDINVWRDNGWGPFREDQQRILVRLFPGVPDEAGTPSTALLVDEEGSFAGTDEDLARHRVCS